MYSTALDIIIQRISANTGHRIPSQNYRGVLKHSAVVLCAEEHTLSTILCSDNCYYFWLQCRVSSSVSTPCLFNCTSSIWLSLHKDSSNTSVPARTRALHCRNNFIELNRKTHVFQRLGIWFCSIVCLRHSQNTAISACKKSFCIKTSLKRLNSFSSIRAMFLTCHTVMLCHLAKTFVKLWLKGVSPHNLWCSLIESICIKSWGARGSCRQKLKWQQAKIQTTLNQQVV